MASCSWLRAEHRLFAYDDDLGRLPRGHRRDCFGRLTPWWRCAPSPRSAACSSGTASSACATSCGARPARSACATRCPCAAPCGFERRPPIWPARRTAPVGLRPPAACASSRSLRREGELDVAKRRSTLLEMAEIADRASKAGGPAPAPASRRGPRTRSGARPVKLPHPLTGVLLRVL